MSVVRETISEATWHATVAAAPEPLPPGFEPRVAPADAPDANGIAALETLRDSPIRCTVLVGHGSTGSLTYAGTGIDVATGFVRTLASTDGAMAPVDGIDILASDVEDLAALLLSTLPDPTSEWTGEESAEAVRSSLNSLIADTSISIEGVGSVPSLLRLLLGGRGWVSLQIDGEQVTNTPLSEAGIESLLSEELSAALGRAALASAGGRS